MFKWQVQYMACRDSDGNFVSADSVDVSREHHQERISEENVCSGPCFIYFFSHVVILLLSLVEKLLLFLAFIFFFFFFWVLDGALSLLGNKIWWFLCSERQSWYPLDCSGLIKWAKVGEMSWILMMLFLSMVQTLFAYMRCSWAHLGSFLWI